jgi:hypothetical protein
MVRVGINAMPKPRYTVRAGDNRRYSVWDNERDKIATSPSVDREYSHASTCARLIGIQTRP